MADGYCGLWWLGIYGMVTSMSLIASEEEDEDEEQEEKEKQEDEEDEEAGGEW